MQHPGEAWTIACAIALAAWSTGGNLYLKHHLLRPVLTGATLAKQHAETARSHPDRLAQKVYMAKARGHVTANRHQLQRADHWQKWVYRPVMLALATVTLFLSGTGVWERGW